MDSKRPNKATACDQSESHSEACKPSSANTPRLTQENLHYTFISQWQKVETINTEMVFKFMRQFSQRQRISEKHFDLQEGISRKILNWQHCVKECIPLTTPI